MDSGWDFNYDELSVSQRPACCPSARLDFLFSISQMSSIVYQCVVVLAVVVQIPSINAKITSTNNPILILLCSSFSVLLGDQRQSLTGLHNENYDQAFCLLAPVFCYFCETLHCIWWIKKNIKVCNHVKNHCKFLLALWCEPTVENAIWLLFTSIRVHFRLVIDCIMQLRLRPQLLVIYKHKKRICESPGSIVNDFFCGK